jgi:putative transposase
MLRIARIVVPKYPHHITQRGTNKSEIFIDTDDRFYFLKLLDGGLRGRQNKKVDK